DISVARYLIEQGADVFARDSSGGMALDNVAGCGWPDVQPLIDEAAARDPQFLARALLYTARGGNVEIARYLIGRGADARGDRKLSWAPICLASFHGHLDMVRFLIENGADIDHGQGLGNMAAIHAAAASGHLPIVRLLVEHGAGVASVSGGRWTALHLAAMAKRDPFRTFPTQRSFFIPGPGPVTWKKIVHVLLDAGADLNAETEEGWKPIDVATDRVIRRLLFQRQKGNWTDRQTECEECLADAPILTDDTKRANEGMRCPRFIDWRRLYKGYR
ncbi:ankyrin repeat-containing domain protein, partial [Schizophyllum commune]